MKRVSVCFMVLLGLLGLLFTPVPAVPDDNGSLPEEAIEAAFLLNFAQYVEWPHREGTAPDAPIVLAVVGNDPFGEFLDRGAREKSVNGRHFVVHRVSRLKDLTGCDMLYLAPPEDERVGQLPDLLRGRPILTVGEGTYFCQRGGMISFVHKGETIGFQINPDAADAVQIKISSKLLNLASIVSPE